MCRAELELTTPYAKLMCLGLGLMFLGKQDQAEATLEVCVHLCVCLCVCLGLGFISLGKQDRAEATLEVCVHVYLCVCVFVCVLRLGVHFTW